MNTDDLSGMPLRRRSVRVVVGVRLGGGLAAIPQRPGGGGLFVESDRPLATGSMLKLRSSCPVARCDTKSKARWWWSRRASGARPRSPGMGVEFTDSRRRRASPANSESRVV
jgi:hypothetical protein